MNIKEFLNIILESEDNTKLPYLENDAVTWSIIGKGGMIGSLTSNHDLTETDAKYFLKEWISENKYLG